jgi:hypothetical protein
MARAQKLKVYRTAAGFYDAYVAAPSQKAALKAWGSERDLFARGIAEMVTDPALTAKPLASPGTVVKLSRGTTAEQIAALPEQQTKPAVAKADAGTGTERKPTPKSKPKPKRDPVDAAEDALDAVKADFDRKMNDLAEREAELAKDRHRLEQARSAELRAAEDAVQERRQAYDDAMRRWRAARD